MIYTLTEVDDHGQWMEHGFNIETRSLKSAVKMLSQAGYKLSRIHPWNREVLQFNKTGKHLLIEPAPNDAWQFNTCGKLVYMGKH